MDGTVALPNSVPAVRLRIGQDRVARLAPWLMLFARSGGALAAQSLLAVAFAAAGAATPWRAAADWWLASFAVAEVANIAVLAWLLRREGLRYRDMLNVSRRDVKGDLKWLAIAFLVSGPVAFLPNVLLGSALWGNAQVGADLIFRPLPVAGAWAVVIVFPVVHALTELPTYFGYVMPRLQALTSRRWAPMLACAGALSLQHVFLPFLLDGPYIVWRALMYLPFAVWLAWVIDRRPTVLPYLAAGHYLLDLPLPIFILLASLSS